MTVMRKVTVFGDGSIVGTIQKTISLFCGESLAYPSLLDVVTNPAPISCHFEDALLQSLKQSLRHSRLVLAYVPGCVRPSTTIAFVHFLRTELAWEGALVSILPSHHECTELLTCPVFPGSGKPCTYGSLPGHEAIHLPLHLANLLTVLATVSEMFLLPWHGMVTSNVEGIRELREAVVLAKERGDEEEAMSRFSALLSYLEDWDWVGLARTHYDCNWIRATLEELKRNVECGSADYGGMLREVDIVLSKATMGKGYEA